MLNQAKTSAEECDPEAEADQIGATHMRDCVCPITMITSKRLTGKFDSSNDIHVKNIRPQPRNLQTVMMNQSLTWRPMNTVVLTFVLWQKYYDDCSFLDCY